MLLVKLDAQGNKVWQKTFGNSQWNSGYSITPTRDGNFLLATTTVSYSSSLDYDGIGKVYKVDTAGKVLWQTDHTLLTDFWWAREMRNGDVVAVGGGRTAPRSLDVGHITCFDSLGVLKWDRAFTRGNDHAYFRNFQQTRDGGYIMAGFVFKGDSQTEDAWYVKLDSLGCDSVGCPTYYTGIDPALPNGEGVVRVYPNPAGDEVIFTTPSYPCGQEGSFTLRDMLGREVLREAARADTAQSGVSSVTLDISHLPNGIYLWHCAGQSGKLVIAR